MAKHNYPRDNQGRGGNGIDGTNRHNSRPNNDGNGNKSSSHNSPPKMGKVIQETKDRLTPSPKTEKTDKNVNSTKRSLLDIFRF